MGAGFLRLYAYICRKLQRNMALVFTNVALDLTATGVVWAAYMKQHCDTAQVTNALIRDALNIGRGSTDLPSAAKKFGADLKLFAQRGHTDLVLKDDTPTDTNIRGVFLTQGECIQVLRGTIITFYDNDEPDDGSLDYGQLLVIEPNGTEKPLVVVNRARKDLPMQYWEMDLTNGWALVDIFNISPSITTNI